MVGAGLVRRRSPWLEVMHARCAGTDNSKTDAKVCVRVAGTGRRKAVETVSTWSSMTRQILALREHLAAEQVTCVVMEAIRDYWKPFYYLLEDLDGVEVLLARGLALGFRNLTHYIARAFLEAGGFRSQLRSQLHPGLQRAANVSN